MSCEHENLKQPKGGWANRLVILDSAAGEKNVLATVSVGIRLGVHPMPGVYLDQIKAIPWDSQSLAHAPLLATLRVPLEALKVKVHDCSKHGWVRIHDVPVLSPMFTEEPVRLYGECADVDIYFSDIAIEKP